MGRCTGLPLIALIVSPIAHGQNGVPLEFSGKWVCQCAAPGYNLPFPGGNPSTDKAQAALGALLVHTGEDDQALVHLDRAIELNPRELSALVNRGEVFLKLGRRSEGEADLKKAIALDPAGRNASANRARALLKGALPR
jgi:tetratricopeptide (TPR) repeat protein